MVLVNSFISSWQSLSIEPYIFNNFGWFYPSSFWRKNIFVKVCISYFLTRCPNSCLYYQFFLINCVYESPQQTLLSWDNKTWACYLSFFNCFICFNRKIFGINRKALFWSKKFIFKTSYFFVNPDGWTKTFQWSFLIFYNVCFLEILLIRYKMSSERSTQSL